MVELYSHINHCARPTNTPSTPFDIESLKEIHNVILTNRFEKDCVAKANLMIGAILGDAQLEKFKTDLENYFTG